MIAYLEGKFSYKNPAVVYVDVNGAKLKVYEQNRISRLDPKSFYAVGQEVWLMLMPENTLVLKKD